MQRIFGTSTGGSGGGASGGSSGGGPKKPSKPTLQDAISTVRAREQLARSVSHERCLTRVVDVCQTDSRANQIDQKIRLLENDLRKLKDQMAKMPPGSSKNALQQRALNILRQKRMYENQRAQLMQQSFNMEQANMAAENLRNVAVTVDSMKQASKAIKKEYKKMNIDKIEKVQDELEDLMEQANDIQDVMSRSYGVPEYLDEADLDAELAALGDEMYIEESEPSYLDSVSSPPTSEIVQPIPTDSVDSVRVGPWQAIRKMLTCARSHRGLLPTRFPRRPSNARFSSLVATIPSLHLSRLQ